ncbi:MAG: phage minor head protein, partial [Hyphomicrobium sp.]
MASRAPKFTTDPSREALAYFRNKGLTPSFNWQDVWAAEHANAFTVAKATELEILQTIRTAVDDALSKGQTFEDFSKALTPKLQKFGWWGRQFVTDPETGEQVFAQLGSPARLRLIFDANIRTAHAAGQWERAQRTKSVLPFFLYIETTSREPREEHLAQVGTIASVDDPYWDTWFPPNGWNCKCGVRQITKAEAEKLGWKKGDKPPVWPTRPFENKRTGAIEDVPEGIDPGWHTNPAKSRFTMLDQMLSGKLDDIDPTMRAVALKDMTSNWLFRRMASGEFYDIAAPWKTPDIATAVGHLSRDLQKLTGQKSGVVWM